MPGELTRTGQRDALNASFRATGMPTATATTYLALLTADPGKAPTLAGIAEISVAGYARQGIAPGGWTPATDADPSVISNAATITFGPFTDDPPNVTHCALVSVASGTVGDVLAKWTLDVAKDAAVDESIQFAAAALSMSLD